MAELIRALAAPEALQHRPNTPWAIPPPRKEDLVIKGAELPIPEQLRLHSVQYTDTVRQHLKHGGTLDSLVMPDRTIARFVLQTDTTKDVFREVVLPPGVRVKYADEGGEGAAADGAAVAAGEQHAPQRPKAGARQDGFAAAAVAATAGSRQGAKKRDGHSEAPRAMADTRSHRVLMFYELQAAIKSVQTHAVHTGATARLARRLQRRMDEVDRRIASNLGDAPPPAGPGPTGPLSHSRRGRLAAAAAAAAHIPTATSSATAMLSPRQTEAAEHAPAVVTQYVLLPAAPAPVAQAHAPQATPHPPVAPTGAAVQRRFFNVKAATAAGGAAAAAAAAGGAGGPVRRSSSSGGGEGSVMGPAMPPFANSSGPTSTVVRLSRTGQRSGQRPVDGAADSRADSADAKPAHINFKDVIADSPVRRNSQHMHAPLPDYSTGGGRSLLPPEAAKSIHVILALRRPTSPYLRPKGLRPKYLERAAGVAAARTAAAAAVASGGTSSPLPFVSGAAVGEGTAQLVFDGRDGSAPPAASDSGTQSEHPMLQARSASVFSGAPPSPTAPRDRSPSLQQPQPQRGGIAAELGLSGGVSLEHDAEPGAAAAVLPLTAQQQEQQQRQKLQQLAPGLLSPLTSLGAVMSVLDAMGGESQGATASAAPGRSPALRKPVAMAAAGAGGAGGPTAIDESERAGALLTSAAAGRGSVHHASLGRLSADGASLVGGDDEPPHQRSALPIPHYGGARGSGAAQEAAGAARPVSAAVASAHAAAASAAAVAAAVTAKLGPAPSPLSPAAVAPTIETDAASLRPQLDAAALLSPASTTGGLRTAGGRGAKSTVVPAEGEASSRRRIPAPLSYRRTREAAHQAFLATRNWKGHKAEESSPHDHGAAAAATVPLPGAAAAGRAVAAAAAARPVVLTDVTIARLTGLSGHKAHLSPERRASVTVERPAEDDRSSVGSPPGGSGSERDSPKSGGARGKGPRRARIADDAVGADVRPESSFSATGKRSTKRSPRRRSAKSPTFIGGGASPRRQPYLTQEQGHAAGFYATLGGPGKDAPAGGYEPAGVGPVSTHFGHPRPPSSKVGVLHLPLFSPVARHVKVPIGGSSAADAAADASATARELRANDVAVETMRRSGVDGNWGEDVFLLKALTKSADESRAAEHTTPAAPDATHATEKAGGSEGVVVFPRWLQPHPPLPGARVEPSAVAAPIAGLVSSVQGMRHVFHSAVGWSHQEAEQQARLQASRRGTAAASASGHAGPNLPQRSFAYTVPTPVDQRIAAVYSNTRDEVMALVKVQVAAATEEAAKQAQIAEQQRHFAAAVREAAEAQAAIKAADDARRAAANSAIAERRRSMQMTGAGVSAASAAAAAAAGSGGDPGDEGDGFIIISPLLSPKRPPQTPSSGATARFTLSPRGVGTRTPSPSPRARAPSSSEQPPLQKQWPQPPPSPTRGGAGGAGGGGPGPRAAARGRRGVRLSLKVTNSNTAADESAAAISEWGGGAQRPDSHSSSLPSARWSGDVTVAAPAYVGASLTGGGDVGSSSWKPKAPPRVAVAATPRGVPGTAQPVSPGAASPREGGGKESPGARPRTPRALAAGTAAAVPLSARARGALAAVRAEDRQRMRAHAPATDTEADSAPLPAHAVAAAAAAAPADLFSLAHDTVGSLAFQALVQQKAAERAAGASAWADDERLAQQQHDDVAELAILGALAIGSARL